MLYIRGPRNPNCHEDPVANLTFSKAISSLYQLDKHTQMWSVWNVLTKDTYEIGKIV